MRVATIAQRDAVQLQTAQAVAPATLATLAANPADKAAAAQAVGQIATKLAVPANEAIARLKALGAVAPADLVFVAANGPKVQAATATLKAAGAVPAADKAYLAANGAKVAKAQKDNPGQWQTWWWICFAAQLLFVPFIFLLKGHWSPSRARAEEQEHEAMVSRELAKLQGGPA